MYWGKEEGGERGCSGDWLDGNGDSGAESSSNAIDALTPVCIYF